MLEPDREYGVFKSPWTVSFGFSDMGVRGLLVLSEKIPEQGDGNIVITLDSSLPEFQTITLPYERVEEFMALFDLKKGFVSPGLVDFKTAMSNPVRNEALNLCILETFPIKNITVNGARLYAPYPSVETFTRIFDLGVGKFPTAIYYDYWRQHRNMISAASGTSEKDRQIPDGEASLFPRGVKTIKNSELKNSAFNKYKDSTAFRYESKYKDLSVIDFNAITEHPLGIPALNWGDSDMELLQGLIEESIGFEGLYKYKYYNNFWTHVILNADFELPEKMVVGNSVYALRTRAKEKNQVSLSFNYKKDDTVSVGTSFNFYLQPVRSDGVVLSDKALHKELIKYYERLIESLRKSGFNLKRDKGEKYKYSVGLPGGRFMRVELDSTEHGPRQWSRIGILMN